MRKLFRGALLFATYVALFAAATTTAAQAAATTQSVAFPMYQYPTIGTLWSDIHTAGSQVPWIIANPDNGPGSSIDPNYTNALNNIASGQRAVGYVYTSYHTRSISQVITDIDNWYAMYPQISGIFVDLVQNGGAANDVCYAATLHNYVKGKRPNDLVVMNPGSNIEAAYEPFGDIFANAENTYAAYSSWTPLTDGFENNAAYANRFWHIVHTASSGQLNTALNLTRTNNAGWVLITDEVMPNPYTAVPSYWSTFLTGVSSLPQTQIPNRGLTQLPSGCIDLSLGTSTSTSAGAQQATSTFTNTVTNTDSARTSWGTTTLTYTAPTGTTLASLSGGSGWSCTLATATCNYAGNLAANSSLASVTATFTAGCSFTGGNATVSLKNFANNTASTSMNIAKPTGCTAAATNSNAGGASTPAQQETPSVTTTTQEPVSTGGKATPSTLKTTGAPQSDSSAASFPIVPFLAGGTLLVLVIAGVIWWLVARARRPPSHPDGQGPTYYPQSGQF